MGEISPEPHGRSAGERQRAEARTGERDQAAWVDADGVPVGHTATALTAKKVRGYGLIGAAGAESPGKEFTGGCPASVACC